MAKLPRKPCATGCGRHVRAGRAGTLCPQCRLAWRQGYYLSPAADRSEVDQAIRAERVKVYRSMIEQGQRLFE